MLLCISTGRTTLADSINRLKPPKENRRKPDKQSGRTGKHPQIRQIAGKTSERRRCYKRHRWPVKECNLRVKRRDP